MTSDPIRWFRMYAEAVDDEKLRLLAFEDRWHFVALLCCKAQGLLDGTDVLTRRKVAVKLGLDSRELEEIARRLAEVGLIDASSLQPMAWDRRQFKSDDSKERVRAYREKRAASGLSKSSGGYLVHYPRLMARDGNRCVYCGSQDNLCIDHVFPVIHGGTDDIDNLAIACKRCNSGKAGRTPDQAGYVICHKPALDAFTRYVSRRVTVTETAQETETETEKTKRTRSRAAVRPDSVPERVWQDFQAIRRAKRTPLTDTALNGIAREASKAGMSLSEALAMCCERGWQGFNAGWVDKPKDRTAGGKLKVAI